MHRDDQRKNGGHLIWVGGKHKHYKAELKEAFSSSSPPSPPVEVKLSLYSCLWENHPMKVSSGKSLPYWGSNWKELFLIISAVPIQESVCVCIHGLFYVQIY